MLTRIFLIVAILAALAAGTLNILQVRTKITTLISQRDDEHNHRVTAETDLASTKKTLATTQDNLKQTQSDLADAKTARKKAEDIAAAKTKDAANLADQLAKATSDRDTAQAELQAYKVASGGKSPKEVEQLANTLRNAQETIDAINAEKVVLARNNVRLKNELRRIIGEDQDFVKLRADLKGEVVKVDPKWDFVVLNIGDDQGALEDGELLVSRSGKLVAKIIIRNVEKGRCVANVVPGWKLGEIFEGDVVTPAHPAS
jgi:capsular polysaccharide biosynthesis protein